MENSNGFDVDATRRWVTGVLQDPAATAVAYREVQPSWRTTFTQITLPVYVISAVAGFIVSLIFGGTYPFAATAASPFYFLITLLWSIASVFVVAFIFDYFAGVFQGTRGFDGAFAAISLSFVPALIAGILGPIPWIGWLFSLVGVIYALVLLYRFIPLFMNVPQDKRPLHFVVSLVVTFVVNLVIAGLLALMFAPAVTDYGRTGDFDEETSSGWLGGFERQADVADQASRDTYDPPEDGRLTERQVAQYARTLQRTSELRERLGQRFENTDGEREPSFGDVFSGVQDAVRLGTAEMEVVKTGGGNWAEHQWVKNQIEVARIQKDSTPAVEHNYELFLEYQDAIEQYE